MNSQFARKESRIELYHNQLTNAQGIFSMRSFMDSFGLHAIANNIDTPTTVLDFPTVNRFIREIKKGYDIVGIGAIVPNFQKVKYMVELIREHSPRSKVVLGGFCAAIPDIEKLLDVDHVCIGEGISFMRELLGMPPEFDFKNPDVFHRIREILGVPFFGADVSLIVVGLGCSYGCDFCSPSHFFGRRHIRFLKSGQDLFNEVERVTDRYHSDNIGFIGDDNFLLDLDRAEEFRECVIKSGKLFNFFIFGSADRVKAFGAERLAEMGVFLIWIGRESRFADYGKNRETDIKSLVAELRSYGIKTILSSILLLDQHTPENIIADIDDHLSCRPAFSQFSFYSPLPGTPLFERMSAEKRILTAIPFEEWHAFKQPWFAHPRFNLKEAEKIQQYAYDRDFRELGPSLMRHLEVDYRGWAHMKDSTKPHLAARARAMARRMPRYRQVLLAMNHLLPPGPGRDRTARVLAEVEATFGRVTAADRAVARGLYLTGRFREIRTRFFGDAIQPRTRVVHYN